MDRFGGAWKKKDGRMIQEQITATRGKLHILMNINTAWVFAKPGRIQGVLTSPDISQAAVCTARYRGGARQKLTTH